MMYCSKTFLEYALGTEDKTYLQHDNECSVVTYIKTDIMDFENQTNSKVLAFFFIARKIDI